MMVLAAHLWPADLSSWLLAGAVVGGLLVAVATLVWLLNRKRPPKRIYDHRELFEALCRAHGLDRKSRRLLQEVARFYGLAYPARLFVERKLLFPYRLSPELRARSAELGALRRQLFFAPNPKGPRGR